MIEKMPQEDVDMLQHTSLYMWEIATRLNQIIDVINSQEVVVPEVLKCSKCGGDTVVCTSQDGMAINVCKKCGAYTHIFTRV